MSATRTKAEQRRIRRAIGGAATDAFLDIEQRSQDIDRFLLLRYSLWRRCWWLLTGRF